VLNEVVEDRAMGILLNESDLPFSTGAKAAAELLGVDLLQVASEGRMILIADATISEPVLKIWKSLPEGRGATRIGVVTDAKGRVVLETVTGGRRLVDVPRGELLPRIC
jgi:hydrogenase expression/formation protein HypE